MAVAVVTVALQATEIGWVLSKLPTFGIATGSAVMPQRFDRLTYLSTKLPRTMLQWIQQNLEVPNMVRDFGWLVQPQMPSLMPLVATTNAVVETTRAAGLWEMSLGAKP